MSSYFSSFFGSTEEPKKEAEDEEAQKRDARRRKAAAAARKKREEAGNDDSDIASFTVASRKSSGRQAAPSSSAAAGARVLRSRPSGSDSDLPAISEDAVAHAASAQAWGAATADPEEMKRFAARAQAAQEQAVADLMEQVKTQQQEELAAAVAAAKEEVKNEMQQEYEKQLNLALEEASEAAAEVQNAAVESAVAEAEAVAQKGMDEALAAAEEASVHALEEAKADWEKQAEEAMEELRSKLEKQYQATLVTSAAMVRQAQTEGNTKLDEQLVAMRDALSEEHEADKLLAVTQARLEAEAEKADAIADAEEAVKAAHQLETKHLAERQKNYNLTFKKLLQEFVGQPDGIASATAEAAALRIKGPSE